MDLVDKNPLLDTLFHPLSSSVAVGGGGGKEGKRAYIFFPSSTCPNTSKFSSP